MSEEARYHRKVRSIVISWLHLGWSPELICGRLKLTKGINLSYETIYKFIYSNKEKDKKLYQYLVKAHKKRRKINKHQGNHDRCGIKFRKSIDKRPKKINDRREFGHWEADSVVSGKNGKGALHTEIERKSRLKIVRKIKDMTSETTINVQLELFSKLPKKARRSVTQDNGVENHLHYKLSKELDMDTYFCDPYSSWQKGSNENANGLYRRVFPKGTDFSTVPDEDIQWMVRLYNNRPMKCLGYLTPQETFDIELSKLR